MTSSEVNMGGQFPSSLYENFIKVGKAIYDRSGATKETRTVHQFGIFTLVLRSLESS